MTPSRTSTSFYLSLCYCATTILFAPSPSDALPLSSPGKSIVSERTAATTTKATNGGDRGRDEASAVATTTTTSKPEKDENDRRSFLHDAFGSVVSTAVFVRPPRAAAAAVLPIKKASSFDPSSLVQVGLETEEILLKLLPVKNRVFRGLEKDLFGVSVLRSPPKDEVEVDPSAWIALIKRMQTSVTYLDSQRGRLEPVFDQEDSTALEIAKAERGERLVEELREQLNVIIVECLERDVDRVLSAQGRALRVLSELGELLVKSFPYDVPSEGKFGYLPRLLGRAEVTFTVKRPTGDDRDGTLLGNVTVLADGFLAPVTAGNFVDLSARDFYTGLPVKTIRKRLGVKPLNFSEDDDTVAYDIADTIDRLKDGYGALFRDAPRTGKDGDDPDDGPGTATTTDLPVLGSYGEGFYDPLTAKPRRIPLEVLEQRDPRTAEPTLSYERGFSDLVDSGPSSSRGRCPVVPGFDVPGLVALNHPDKNLNGGSSEFFSLRDDDRKAGEVKLLNGMYAPFGYVISGLNIMEQLEPGDIITSTFVNEWGRLNLKRIRGKSFADAMNKDEDV